MTTISSYLTGENIAATVMMARTGQVNKRPIILTEGLKDQRVIKTSVRAYVDIVPGYGKAETLDALSYLPYDNVKEWLLVIVDADFDRILNVTHSDIVILTDCHDMDCEHIRSYALVKVVQEVCSPAKCLRHFNADPNTESEKLSDLIRISLLTVARPLGILRLLSIIESLNLTFRNLDHKKSLHSDRFEVDIDSLVRIVIANSGNVAITHSKLKARVALELGANYDPWQVCQGHDLASYFVHAVRKYWGISKISEDDIERNMRLAFESDFFWSTSLGSELKTRLKLLGVAL